MIEDRHVELIHAELDGELTSEQRAELSRVLLANPEARALRDQLSRLFAELGKLEEVDPPAELAESVLNAIDRATPRSARPARQAWYTGPALRYAAVFVGGLLLSAALFGPGMNQVAGPDVSELVGTIGGHGYAGRGSPIDRVDVDLEQVKGVVNSYRVDGQLAVELDLAASEPIDVVARHAGQAMHMSLESRPDGTPERVVWLPTGQVQSDPQVELELYSGGQLVHRGSLQASPGGRPE
jgi:anti-sigma factor RsiW